MGWQRGMGVWVVVVVGYGYDSRCGESVEGEWGDEYWGDDIKLTEGV